MSGIYANIWSILMVNVTLFGIHGSYGVTSSIVNLDIEFSTTRGDPRFAWDDPMRPEEKIQPTHKDWGRRPKALMNGCNSVYLW